MTPSKGNNFSFSQNYEKSVILRLIYIAYVLHTSISFKIDFSEEKSKSFSVQTLR